MKRPLVCIRCVDDPVLVVRLPLLHAGNALAAAIWKDGDVARSRPGGQRVKRPFAASHPARVWASVSSIGTEPWLGVLPRRSTMEDGPIALQADDGTNSGVSTVRHARGSSVWRSFFIVAQERLLIEVRLGARGKGRRQPPLRSALCTCLLTRRRAMNCSEEPMRTRC